MEDGSGHDWGGAGVELLRELLGDRSVRSVAEDTGISKSALSRYLNGTRPDSDRLRVLDKALGARGALLRYTTDQSLLQSATSHSLKFAGDHVGWVWIWIPSCDTIRLKWGHWQRNVKMAGHTDGCYLVTGKESARSQPLTVEISPASRLRFGIGMPPDDYPMQYIHEGWYLPEASAETHYSLSVLQKLLHGYGKSPEDFVRWLDPTKSPAEIIEGLRRFSKGTNADPSQWEFYTEAPEQS